MPQRGGICKKKTGGVASQAVDPLAAGPGGCPEDYRDDHPALCAATDYPMGVCSGARAFFRKPRILIWPWPEWMRGVFAPVRGR